MASLTEILILRGVVPIENLDTISGSWGEDEEAVRQLVERGIVSPIQLASARAAQASLPFVELADYPVERTAIALIPAAVCRRYNVLPIGVTGDAITLAMADPGNVFAIDDVRAVSRMQIKPVVAAPGDLKTAIDQAFMRRIRFLVHVPFPEAAQRAGKPGQSMAASAWSSTWLKSPLS